MNFDSKIYVAGHQGMVGSAIVRNLMARGYNNILLRTHDELDLTDQAKVKAFFATEKPDQVYLAAARVGGIYANNTFPAEFIYSNLMIQNNVIHQAYIYGVKKLLILGSSCIYPKNTPQPIPENALLTGALEETNEPYAIAKISGIKMCESYNRQYGVTRGVDYRSIMPTNLYGPGDNYHGLHSHVIPALIKRFHEAKKKQLKEVFVWGTGAQKREFLYVDDLASACIFIMNLDKELHSKFVKPSQSHINVGSGEEVTISDLAYKIAEIVQYNGDIKFDTSQPDGPSQKKIDSTKITELGWKSTVNLENGLKLAYKDYCSNLS